MALEAPADKTGLHGILKNEVPTGLDVGFFQRSDRELGDVGKGGLGPRHEALHRSKSWMRPASATCLKQLQKKIHTMDKALADPRFRVLVRSDLVAPRPAGPPRRRRRSAILNTLELKPEEVKAERVKAANADALGALSDLEADLNTVPNGSAWLPYIQANELRQALTSNKAGRRRSPPCKRSSIRAARSKMPSSGNSSRGPRFASFRRPSPSSSRPKRRTPAPATRRPRRTSSPPSSRRSKATRTTAASADAHKVHEALDAAEKAAIDDGSLIDQAVREHYMNYNLQVVASAGRAQRRSSSDSAKHDGPGERTSSWGPMSAGPSGRRPTSASNCGPGRMPPIST